MAALSVDGTPMPALPNSADQINYDNTTSGLSATTVKGAVDELASEKQDATDNNLTTTNKTIVGGINELKSGLTNLDDRFVPDDKFDTASINLDTVTSTLFGVYNGQNISGTTPFTLTGDIGHVVMVFAGNSAMVTEMVVSAYEKKLGFRCKVYTQGTWQWRAWEVMSMT